MSYTATIPVDFACIASQAYEALILLGTHPTWVEGMTNISHAGIMTEGLIYTSTSIILGHTNTTKVRVMELVPNKRVVIQSQAGLVDFKAEYRFENRNQGHCSVICMLDLKFSSAVFNLARPVAEAVIESRITADLERLRSMLNAD